MMVQEVQGFRRFRVQGSGSEFTVHQPVGALPFAGLEVSQQPGGRFGGSYLQVEEAGRIFLGEVVLGSAVLDVVACFEQ